VVKKKGNVQEIATEGRPIAIEEAAGKADLRSNLAEIKKHDGVVGYILKDTSCAVVDLNEPARISDYAVFSSATSEAASELSDIFGLGGVKRIVVGGKHMKMLSMHIGESKVSVFMEKNADVDGVCEKLQEF
jgi:predicted regulator of Ras-like GTPase activity (Roadblock/LC7/MglB family)